VIFAQNDQTIVSTINIQVNVQNQMNIKRAKNIQLVVHADSTSKIDIDPKQDEGAGSFEVVGSGSAAIRISFPAIMDLKQVNGDFTIQFHTTVSSYTARNQNNSELLNKNADSLKLNDQGQRFFWVGGSANIKNAPGGQYVGTMSFNLEYD